MNPEHPSASEQEQMIAFALRWLPYGGGSAEDITVTFGVSPEAFFGRLAAVLADPDRAFDVDRTTRGALLQVCHRRMVLRGRDNRWGQ